MKVYTFYSFKGGVGRTALLTHLAVQWADRGRVVVVVDMDIHAPGISYSPNLRKHPDEKLNELGVGDLLAEFYSSRDLEKGTFNFYPPSKLLRDRKSDDPKGIWGSNGRFLVLPAGKTNQFQIQKFSESRTHKVPPKEGRANESLEEWALRFYAQKFIEDLAAFKPEGADRGVDYVLIDCCPGYLDLVDLTMGYMADRIVLVSGLNHQNIAGLDETLKSLRDENIRLGLYSSKAMIIFSPVPSHFHDQPETREALQRGVDVVKSYCLPLDDDSREGVPRKELFPPMFTLPYTLHLAISDKPLQRDRVLGELPPYWERIYEIVDELDSQSTSDEIRRNLNAACNSEEKH
ncbi:MAG TPA: hypothetical protein HPQ00_01425 [Magnetococcales bacterium]|nr:hypothetical protein [Magnetococcales bacterium]